MRWRLRLSQTFERDKSAGYTVVLLVMKQVYPFKYDMGRIATENVVRRVCKTYGMSSRAVRLDERSS